MFARLYGYSLMVTLPLLLSSPVSAHDPTGAHWDKGFEVGYNQGLLEGYWLGLINAGGGSGRPGGGTEMTTPIGGGTYFGILPEQMLGIGGGPGFFNSFCGAENQGKDIRFEAAFDGVKMLEHLHEPSSFPIHVVDRIMSGQEVFVKGYAFDGAQIVESKGQLQWHAGQRPRGGGRIVMDTKCPESSDQMIEGVTFMKELGVSTGVAIELMD